VPLIETFLRRNSLVLNLFRAVLRFLLWSVNSSENLLTIKDTKLRSVKNCHAANRVGLDLGRATTSAVKQTPPAATSEQDGPAHVAGDRPKKAVKPRHRVVLARWAPREGIPLKTFWMMIAAFLCGATIATPSLADTAYKYTGNHYTTCSGWSACNGTPPYPPYISLTFHTSMTASQLANLPLTDITSTVTSFKFSDNAGEVFDQTTGGTFSFYIATGSNGLPFSWYAEVYNVQGSISLYSCFNSICLYPYVDRTQVNNNTPIGYSQSIGTWETITQADRTVFRPSTGQWFILPSTNPRTPIIQSWGLSGDIPVRGDFDGDGKTDFAVWRPSTGEWFIIPSSNPSNIIVQQWGVSGDVPVPGDYDGDGKTDFAVWRPSTGEWFIIPSSNPSNIIVQQWGVSGDVPVPGDYDGDAKTDFAVWRPSNGTWYVIPSSNPSNIIVQQWGVSGDIPVPGDYDGDGNTDFAVWRSSNGTWYVIPSSAPTNYAVTKWGVPTDVPVQKPIGQ
jgi:hypothetical protein